MWDIKSKCSDVLTDWLKKNNAPAPIYDIANMLTTACRYAEMPDDALVSNMDNEDIVDTIKSLVDSLNELGINFL